MQLGSRIGKHVNNNVRFSKLHKYYDLIYTKLRCTAQFRIDAFINAFNIFRKLKSDNAAILIWRSEHLCAMYCILLIDIQNIA